MKQIFIITPILFLSVNVLAQTKEIAFKSHSGSRSNFDIAMKEEIFSPEESDFGMAPTTLVTESQLDSVIYVSDSTAYMVTSQYCSSFYRRSSEKPKATELWNAGKILTLYHPLFTRRHSLDSIKKVLSKQYNFRNQVDNVVFVGYDNDKDQCDENIKVLSMPVVVGPNDQTPFGPTFTGILCLIIGCSLAGAWLSWKYGYGSKKIMPKQTVIPME